MGEIYLCYDIKGIQQFIFSISKLKYIVAASLMIDQFDLDSDKWAESWNPPQTIKTIFTGGGKGTFECCSQECAEDLRDVLVKKAHEIGLDLRIGIAKSLSEASHHADDLYPFTPDSLEGEPCSLSGLWPTSQAESVTVDGKKGVHPLVAKRSQWLKRGKKREDDLDSRVLEKIRPLLPKSLIEWEKTWQKPLEFLTTVRADSDLSEEDSLTAHAADRALGSRNRWAVLALDGNDMGCQFREFEKQNSAPSNNNQATSPDSRKKPWMQEMSRALKDCTHKSFYHGLSEAIKQWWAEVEKDKDSFLMESFKVAKTIVLPFRPLILGGDDILCLCHCSYAMKMAQDIIVEFNKLSIQKNNDYQQKNPQAGDLWPGTNGQLTISAGIAYSGVTLPLSLSIPYAEKLLANAKKCFRGNENNEKPTPSAIDWESITESMIDTPSARRTRDLTFRDKDHDETTICLTMRPYRTTKKSDKKSSDKKSSETKTLEEIITFKKELEKLPRSFVMELMTTLTLPWAQRVPRLVAMAVQRPVVLEWLDEDITGNGQWGECWSNKNEDDKGKKKRTNWFLDALSLLEEEKRMEKDTVS